MRPTVILLSICCMMCISGCWDNKNIQDLLYVTAIGVDYKNDLYEAYVQTVSFGQIAKTENGGAAGPKLYVGKGRGKTLTMALNQIYDTVQRRIYWSHVRTYLFTESAIQAGGDDYFDNLKRYREFRYTPWIFGTKGSIEEVLKAPSFFRMSPITTILGQPEENYLQKSFIKPLQAQEYQINLNEPGETALIPTLTIDKTSWQTEEKSDPKLKINGVFAVRKNNFQGWLANSQLGGLRWMTKETSRTPLETKSAVISLEKPKHQISVIEKDGNHIFNIVVKVRGNVVQLIDKHRSEQEMEKEAEEQIIKEIRSTYEDGLRIGADVYNFRNVMFKKRFKNWQDIDLTSSSLNQIDVQVHFQHLGELKKS
ncbi:Ger(x)C family spore germination protein [Paenibacillus aceris]|uniref:Ger(X)C family germination protein n=1 Tax=Paenibacillus aceris TaxID=869555 RepID=A0ABS4I0V8_9BACL|nr:Ger(x)C family spore germination protein [Paenibacillus aceris]MBP1964196.1 Ger(x)C family germination protein [Paenibacillus aceris]NHW36522.1 Ger(x)C family spore germination protein [Paenibacillus aceris]